MDSVAAKYMENLGFALVIVNPRPGSKVSASDGTGGLAAASSKKLEENFMSSVPETIWPGTAGTSMGARLSANNARAKKSRKEPEPYKYFPRLGLYIGYMDREGAKKTEQAGASIHGTESFSLIRPVAKKLATAKGDLTWGLKRLSVKKLWESGLDGKGVRVGHLDTGVDGKHKALRGRLKAFVETDESGDIIDDSHPISKKAYDSGEHGTHTAGTICGGEVDGMAIGVAPKCDLFSALVIEGGQVIIRVLTGLEWCLQNNVRVVSMSLGFRGYTPVFLDVIQRLRENGALPVIAIGNEGRGTSRSPGNYSESLSVGAIDANNRVAEFSSSIKFQRPVEPDQPNVVAPGVDVISARPHGGVQSMDGTSMATPHVAGVAAILFGAEPNATVEQVERAIQTTCKLLPSDTRGRYGFGLVRPEAALTALRKMA